MYFFIFYFFKFFLKKNERLDRSKMVFQSRHCLTKGRSVAQGNDGMEPGEPNWRDPAVSASQASPRTRQTIRIRRCLRL